MARGNKKKIKVCYFGFYNQTYSRNRIILNGLRKNRVEVVECHTKKAGIIKYFDLIISYLKIKKDFNILIIGFPGFQSVFLAKLLCRKPIIFDAFISLYDSNVCDRKLYPKNSVRAWINRFLDKYSCRLATLVLMDTKKHIEYFVQEYDLLRGKFKRLLLGTDDTIFFPQEMKNKNDEFLVHFHASGLSLQGVEFVIEASQILKNENIVFNFIGSRINNEYKNRNFLNVNLYGNVEYIELNSFINKADVCLGIFGSSDKTNRVIPNKIYEAIACRKAVISAKTDAMDEVFEDRENILFCDRMNAKDLADKILILKNNSELRETIAKNSFDLYKRRLTPSVIGAELLEIVSNL